MSYTPAKFQDTPYWPKDTLGVCSIQPHFCQSSLPTRSGSEALPTEIVRKVAEQLLAVNETNLSCLPWSTPRSRWLAYLHICKEWYPIFEDQLYANVRLERSGMLESFIGTVAEYPELLHKVRTVYFRDLSPRWARVDFLDLRFTRLRELHLHSALVSEVPSSWNTCAASVTTLRLTYVEFKDTFSLEAFLTPFKSVKHLYLDGPLSSSQDQTLGILRNLGRDLHTFHAENIYATSIDQLLILIPNVKNLSLQVSSRVAWRTLSSSHIPSSVQTLALQSWDYHFLLDFLVHLSSTSFLPNLKHLPLVDWRPTRHELYSSIDSNTFRLLKTVGVARLRQQGIFWSKAESFGTVFDGSEHVKE